jgi:hypothetical protein
MVAPANAAARLQDREHLGRDDFSRIAVNRSPFDGMVVHGITSLFFDAKA